MTAARWLVAVVLAGCTEHVQLAPDGRIPGLVGLEVTPPAAMVAFDGLAAPDQTVAFAATGSFVDGSTRDVTGLVAWSTDNAAPGAFVAGEPGAYVATGAAGGHVGVRATSGDIVGDAGVTIVVSGAIVDPAFPPPGAPELFAPGTPVGSDPMKRPVVRYPASETRFPQGLARIVFQHQLGTANDTVRMRFDSDVLHLVVLTGTDRWQPDDAAWTLIAASHPGARVELIVDTADSTAPGTMFTSDPVELDFARAPATDAVYIATASIGAGSFAATAQTELPGTAGACCHAASRDGRALALATADKLAIVDLVSLAPIVPTGAIPMGWATFSPDGTLVLVADKGNLVLRDARTGAPVGPGGGKVPLPMGVHATHPDWSPDGGFVAVSTAGAITNADLKGGSIARLAFTDGAWGPLETLVASTGDTDGNFFPRWSPDGSVIAYVHATSGAKDAKMAELRLVPRDGGAPIALALASTRVGPTDTPDLGTTMPAWTTGADGALWLAFASTRPYGVVRPMKGPDQIWVAGIDVARADPSFPAFWLPCNDIAATATSPVWAPPPADDGSGSTR